MSWINVLGGDGGYNAIDPGSPSHWYASNLDIPPGGLGVQICASGVNCNNSAFNFVVPSSTLGGDDGAFYFPYILDPYTSTPCWSAPAGCGAGLARAAPTQP